MIRAALLLTLLAGCTIQLAGSDNTITIAGRATSRGTPVVGATVSVEASSVTTSSDGEFELEVKPTKDRVVLDVSAQGYAPLKSIVTRRDGVFHYNMQLELTPPNVMVMPMTPSGMQHMTVEAGGQTIGIDVPPDAVPPGTTIEVTAFAAENGPGTMETTEGSDRLLQTGGMLYIRAVDPQGNEVTQFSGQGIQVTPGAMTDIGDVGMTQAYALNQDAVWSPSTMTGGADARTLRAQAAGFWNCDRNYRTSCIKGKLAAPKKACGGERVKAGGSNANGLFSQDTTGPNGEFCVEGPAGLNRTLSVGSSNRMITFSRTPGSCRTNPSACLDLGEVMVSDADCPKSCDKDERDSPSGCQPMNQGGTGGGGGGGGNTNAAGFTCTSTQQCSSWSGSGTCRWRACACATPGNCVRGWYETTTNRVFACGECTTNCTSAAQALINSCR